MHITVTALTTICLKKLILYVILKLNDGNKITVKRSFTSLGKVIVDRVTVVSSVQAGVPHQMKLLATGQRKASLLEGGAQVVPSEQGSGTGRHSGVVVLLASVTVLGLDSTQGAGTLETTIRFTHSVAKLHPIGLTNIETLLLLHLLCLKLDDVLGSRVFI